MPVEFKFERIDNRVEEAEIESAVLAALHNTDDHWRVTVVGLRSGHAFIVEVLGPGVRWGDCYPVQPDMLGRIKADLERLAKACAVTQISQMVS